MENNIFKQQNYSMKNVDTKEQDIEELRKFQMECNEKLLEWEKENNIKVGCVLIPVGIKDNQAKMVVESRLWFEKI